MRQRADKTKAKYKQIVGAVIMVEQFLAVGAVASHVLHRHGTQRRCFMFNVSPWHPRGQFMIFNLP